MNFKKEIEKLLESLKSLGHDRASIERKLGYSDNAIDQSLARGGSEKLLRGIELYKEYVEALSYKEPIERLKNARLEEHSLKYGLDSEIVVPKDAWNLIEKLADSKLNGQEINKNLSISIERLTRENEELRAAFNSSGNVRASLPSTGAVKAGSSTEVQKLASGIKETRSSAQKQTDTRVAKGK